MDRRAFIKKAALAGGTVAATGLAAPVIAQGVMELKMVTSWPKSFPGLGTAAERFGARLEAASGGRYVVKIFAGGELVPPLGCHDAVQDGTADMYHSADYYYQSKSKGYAFFTSVPFGLRADEMDAWILHGGGQELWDKLGANFGIKHLPCGNTGAQMGGWFNRPIKSLDDFKGLKMRIPGLGGEVIRALGGTSVTLAGAEILPALESGTVDAVEWVGPWGDLEFGFHNVVKNYYYPGFQEPGSMLGLGLSKKLWDGLSDADKLMFETCALAENNFDHAEHNARNLAALNVLINEHDVVLWEFPDEVFQGFGNAAKDVLADAGNNDAMTKEIYESFLAFRRQAADWSRYSDQAYMNKRALVDF